MKANISKILMIAFGLISVGLLTASIFGLLAWRNIDNFSRRLFQNHSMFYSGMNPSGTYLVIGVILLIGIGTISIIKSTANQSTNEIPTCEMCGEEIVNADGEFCPSCGGLAREK